MIRNILARAFAVPTTSPLLTPHPFPARLHLFPLPTNQSAPTKPIGALKPWTCLNQSSVFGLPSCCEDVATHTLYSWPTRTSYLFTYDFDFDKICLTHLICISVQILSDYDPIESWSSECAVAFKCGMKKVDSIRQWLLRLPWYINFFFDLADLSHLHIKFRVCPRARVSLSLSVCVCVCVYYRVLIRDEVQIRPVQIVIVKWIVSVSFLFCWFVLVSLGFSFAISYSSFHPHSSRVVFLGFSARTATLFHYHNVSRRQYSDLSVN